jgi:hypothetical protein
VGITLFAKGVKKENVTVNFAEREVRRRGAARDSRVGTNSTWRAQVSLRVVLANGNTFEKTWRLFSGVVTAQCTLNVTPYKIEISLKARRPALSRTAALTTRAPRRKPRPLSGTRCRPSRLRWWCVRPQVRVRPCGASPACPDGALAEPAGPPSYPYSGKKLDWDALDHAVREEESKEQPGGDAGLQKLFQTIYKDANPVRTALPARSAPAQGGLTVCALQEQRRAMIKSYQTSGGTVLSTNWDEVKNKDYEKEIQPPKGQEVRKFDL